MPADWPQWGNNPQHQAAAALSAQPLEAILAEVLSDPFVALESAETREKLLVRYAAPLIDETGIYIEDLSGSGDRGGLHADIDRRRRAALQPE